MRQTAVVLLTGYLLLAPATSLHAQAPPQGPGLTPAAPATSDLRLRIERVGAMPTRVNPTSPAVAGSHLLLIDQGGFLYRWDGAAATPLLSARTLPPGVTPLAGEWLLNVAANRAGTRVYVMFVSSTLPKGVPTLMSPRDPDGWYVLFEYHFDGTSLTEPRGVTALQMRSDGHTGGGLVVADDGSVLFAVGDNGDSYEDGREYGQAMGTHLAKLVRITPADGTVKVAALGVRSPQRLSLVTSGERRWVAFVDPGGWVAEEVNAVPLDDLLADAVPNFGWGRRLADGTAREGTFFIDRAGNSRASIPADETGFVQPIAQFGRTDHEPIAVSGPVSAPASFSRITLLFGDLVTGRVLATTGSIDSRRQPVLDVALVDAAGQGTTLRTLAGDARPDPRFFTFPDGTAGVLLEKTGEFHRLTEVR